MHIIILMLLTLHPPFPLLPSSPLPPTLHSLLYSNPALILSLTPMPIPYSTSDPFFHSFTLLPPTLHSHLHAPPSLHHLPHSTRSFTPLPPSLHSLTPLPHSTPSLRSTSSLTPGSPWTPRNPRR